MSIKLAVLSDVHGNMPALEAVTEHIERWLPDVVILNGDIVNRGPLSAECLQFVFEKQVSRGWHVLQGNHEEFVIQRKRPFSGDNLLHENIKSSQWTYENLNGDVAALEALPTQLRMNFSANAKLVATHASLRGNRDGLRLRHSDDELRERIPEEKPNIFLTSHTHVPLVKQLDETLIVNTGSVGAPLDGDERSSYAQVVLNNGRFSANIIRIPYDRAQTKRDWQTSGYLTDSGAISKILYADWLTATPHLPSWYKQYIDPLRSGKITVPKAVAEYLNNLNIDVT